MSRARFGRDVCATIKTASMPEFDFTAHARDMLTERNIPEDWVWRVLNGPSKKRMGDDGNMH